MLIVVTGGSGSGKSLFAETMIHHLCPENKLYLATMIAYDEESKKRVIKHRKQRDHKGFITIESPTHIEKIKMPNVSGVLLECMSNLVANEMYDASGRKQDVVDHVVKGVQHLRRQAEHVILVTNEIFSGGEVGNEMQEYLSTLGNINQRVVEKADVFIEVVYGIPIFHKGNQQILGGQICQE
ncbi:MAG: bifunctional adenosylcobinamide kinase/adenosylcobinamide-phosphate guanylyltransferase [Lachnospiraceae bacterium]